jgi:hypothetical protein
MEINEYTPGENGPRDIWLIMTRDEIKDLYQALHFYLDEPEQGEWHHHLEADDAGIEVTIATPGKHRAV